MREGRAERGPLAGLFTALLVLDVAWCVASLMLPGLPGWKMFAGGASPPCAVVDAAGHAVELRTFLPSHATLQDARSAVEVARFACRRRQLDVPAVVTFGATRVAIDAGCSARW